MHPELTELIADLTALKREGASFVTQADDAAFRRRPGPTAWSAAECVTHLNITNAAMIPLIDAGIAAGEPIAPGARARFARDPLGWMLSNVLEPPVRWGKTPTIAPFVPGAVASKGEITRDWEALHDQLIDRVTRAEELQWGLIILQSLFNPKIKYNLYSAYRITTAHDRRHLWQARRALTGLHL